MKQRKTLSFLLTLVMMVGSLSGLFPVVSFAEEQPEAMLSESNEMSVTSNVYSMDDLILHYDMKTLDTVGGDLIINDVSGSGRGMNGTLKNPAGGELVSNAEVGFAAFNGGSSTSNSSYVEIPKDSNGSDLLSGLTDTTVSSLVNWDNDGANRWIFGLGTVTSNAETGHRYFFASPRHGINNTTRPVASGISKGGWRNEALITGPSTLTAGDWKLVTIVFSGAQDTVTIFVDGVKVSSGSAKGIKLSEIIDPASGFSGFLGKSIFTTDNYLKGKIADFRVYNRSFTEEEVTTLYTETSDTIPKLRQLTLENAEGSLDIVPYLAPGDTEEGVTKKLTLPTVGKNGVSLSWTSDTTAVLANDGTVTRPSALAEDAQVELTANLTYMGLTAQKTFLLTILKEFSDQNVADADVNAIEIPNADSIKGNIRLPITGELGSSISWVSSHPQIIKGSNESVDDNTLLGRVARPAADTSVILTATAVKGTANSQKTFTLNVKKSPNDMNYDAYFFAYFTGEYEGGEEISFATANDPLKWEALNNGKSIIQSTMGEEGLRDPFVFRSAEGDKFYLLATDLKMGESTNFNQAQITGSHSIMIWESEDLVNWSEQRMVEIAPKTGGNTWAPEAFYDQKTGDYVVFWASSMKIADTYGKYASGRPTGQYNVMYYATTRDFYTFSEPKVYMDEAFPTIDTTMYQENGSLYRFTKSELNYKLFYEKANHIFYDKDSILENGYQFEPISGTRNGNNGIIGHGSNNEGPTVFKDLREDKWYLFLDSWPYHVRVTTDLDDGQQFVNNLLPESSYALPPGPRHGSVIPISRSEYDALQSKYGVPGPTPSNSPVVHYTFDEGTVSGTTVKDISNHGYDAKLVGGAQVTSADKVGETGGSIDLDGTSGYVELPQNLMKNLNLEKMTMSTWVKTDVHQPNQRIFDFSSSTGRVANRNSMYLSTQGDSGNLEFAVVTPFTEKFANDTTLLGSAYKYALRANQPTGNVWHHVAVTINDFDAVLYVDGVEAARSSVFNVEPRMLLDTAMNYIGKSSKAGQSLFNGKFDDFRIYNRALDEEEIEVLADATVPIPEENPIKLILHYDMKHVEGATVKDQTGVFNGTWINPENGRWMQQSEAGALSFSGGAANSYVELPQGVMDGLSDVTVSSLVNWKGINAAEWIFAFGQDRNKYLYATPKRNSGNNSARAGLGITSWSNEAGANSIQGTLPANQWKQVTTVVSGKDQTIKLYIDGVEVAASSTNGYTLAQINNAAGRSGFIGKSFYTEDPYFGGMIADFRVYDGAMTGEQVSQLNVEGTVAITKLNGIQLSDAAARLDYPALIGKNLSKNEISGDLTLPLKGEYGTTITWTSNAPVVINEAGKVYRPVFSEGNQSVILTATLTDGVGMVHKSFTFNVVHLPSDTEAVMGDAEALIVRNIANVRGNLTLPTVGANGSIITWSSEQSDLITTLGVVNRPANGSGDQIVNLTATLQLNDAVITKGFRATVKEMPVEQEYKGYAFTYFTGEGYANGEQIYFALSEGNDPLHWRELNGGNPVFTSELGEMGLRDPYIIRSPEGDKFYLIATDLKMYGSGDWTGAQTNGSRSIMVWESTDMIHWSNQRMVEVSPPEAGNTWAPESFYDKESGNYVVFWASKMYADATRTGSAYQKMMYVTTRDFYTFSDPKVYMDYGYSIIDTTMLEHEGNIYRFTKDERSTGTSAPNGKFIFQESGSSVTSSDFSLIKEGIGQGMISRGEGPTVFKSNTEDKWYMFIDEFGGRGYVPFETTNLESGDWTISADYQLPSRPRHGTVLPVTQQEYDRLAGEVPSVEIPEAGVKVTGISLEPSDISIKVGGSALLQPKVLPVNASNPTVLWTSSDTGIAKVNEDGKVSGMKQGNTLISATTVDGAFLAVSTVIVKAGDTVTPTPTPTPTVSPVPTATVPPIPTATTTPTPTASPASGGGSSTIVVPSPSPTTTPGSATISEGQLVTEQIQTADGRTITKITVNSSDLSTAIRNAVASAQGAVGPVLIINANGIEGSTVIELPIENLTSIANLTVTVVTDGASYSLPVSVLPLTETAAEFGVSLSDLTVQVAIGPASADILEAAAVKAQIMGATLTIEGATEFKVTLSAEGREKEVKDFGNTYITRVLYMPNIVDPTTSTAVMYDPETGEFQYVPAVITTKEGKSEVQIKRQGNSIYTVLQYTKQFTDMNTHWAKADVEKMASKLIVNGTTPDLFEPNRQITRAEFTALLVRSLGMNGAVASANFTDVDADAWYASAVGAAVKAGIVNGVGGEQFAPHQGITRAEIAVMIQRAIIMTNPAGIVDGNTVDMTLYRDLETVPQWAIQPIAALLSTGIMNGVSEDSFAPSSYATRAEATVTLMRALKALDFMQ